MNEQEIDKNTNPSSNPFMPSPSSNQSPGPIALNTVPNSATQHTGLDNEKEQLIAKKIKKRGIVSLVVGIIILIGLFLPLIVFGKESNSPAAVAIVYLIYAQIYANTRIAGMILCITFLILSLVDMKKYKIRFSKYVVMTIIGLLLAFSPYVYSGARKAIITSDPFKITAGEMGVHDCASSARRASNENWSDVHSLGGDPIQIADDIACSYLEYIYDNKKEPTSSTQLSQYYQSYNAKNGIATITINADQPDEANIYNIITHRSCTYDDTNNDSAISVWFRVEKKNNGIGCVDVTAREYAYSERKEFNLYDLRESEEWYAWQFEEKISSDEAKKIIEDKRKEQGDDTWVTGSVEVYGKSKDGYYWIKYEEIKNDGTTTKLSALFHNEDGKWIFTIPKTDYDFNRHNFETF